MSPRAAATAVVRNAAATVHAPARTRTTRRPAPARRRSGPAARTVALPRADFVGILDRLLRGPAYIALVGILLAGIVFFNVDVLELNHGIARTDVRASELKRENAALTLKLAKLGSSERIQRVALQRGMVLPQPGDVRYLRAHREDAGRALRVMTAPDSSSAAPVTPALVTQQSSPTPGATSATPTSTPTAVAPTTTTTPVPTQTQTVQTTPAAQTTPTQTAPAAAPATTTQAGAVAAPSTP